MSLRLPPNKKQAALIQKYQQIVNAGEPFTDSEFPPSEISLFNPKIDKEKKVQKRQ
jgi:hypothetical protein